jgi:biopolymer transport protein TolR
MALHVGAGSDPDETVLSEINVTPLVDVMLVLLVIFMITAPMLHQGVEVALPEVEAKNLRLRVENPLVVSIRESEVVYIQDRPVHLSQLVEQLDPILKARGDDWVLLKGDQNVRYGAVMEVMEVLRQGGIENVGMVTKPTVKSRRQR